jgi:RHS repeat-associated protein
MCPRNYPSPELPARNYPELELWSPQAVDRLFAEEQVQYDSENEEFVTDHLYWALTDNLNSIRDLAVSDTSGQTPITSIAEHRVYDAYGNRTSQTAAVDCVFGYTGKLFDAKTELQNNLNRWYDASTGKWISRDPIGYDAGDFNLYRYCLGGPLINTDPIGHRKTGIAFGPSGSEQPSFTIYVPMKWWPYPSGQNPGLPDKCLGIYNDLRNACIDYMKSMVYLAQCRTALEIAQSQDPSEEKIREIEANITRMYDAAAEAAMQIGILQIALEQCTAEGYPSPCDGIIA